MINLNNKNSRYINEFLHLKCAPDLLNLKLFPNAKEITESFAAYNAVRLHLKNEVQFSNPEVSVYCIGDGHKPRTAATFAFRSAWKCWSIDPLLDPNHSFPKNKVERLGIASVKIEEIYSIRAKIAIIVCVHSHSTLKNCLKTIKAVNRHVIAIECCVPQVLDRFPDIEYRDEGIWSPKNLIKIWKNV